MQKTNPETLEKLLHQIQKEGEKYGLKLNEKKCEAIRIRKIIEEGKTFFWK